MSSTSRNARLSILLLIMLSEVGMLCSPGRADFNISKWRYYSELKPKAVVSAKYAEFTVDPAIFRGAQGDLADLRIVDDAGKEAPFNLLEDRGGTVEASYKATYKAALLNKSVVTGKYTTFMLDLGKPGRINNRVEIETPSTNFMRKVEIEGGWDGLHWATLKADGYIFDFSREYYAESTAVSYPDSTYRYIRVKIWDLEEKPLAIEGATVYWRKIEPAKEVLLLEGGSITQNRRERSTDILMDLGASMPSSRAVIKSPDTNYDRQVEVKGSKTGREWDFLGYEYIFKYDLPGVKAGESSIEYSEASYRYIRLRVQNYDDPPIRISKVQLYQIRRRVVFPYDPNAGYRLYYGNIEAQAPVYDFQRTYKYVASQPRAGLELGPRIENPDFRALIGTKPWLQANPWVIWVVLGVAVILLGLLALRMVRETKASPPGESS